MLRMQKTVHRTDSRPFHVRYKEHAQEFRHGTNKSNYARHLLDNWHPLQPIDNCMEILHTTVKGPMLNTLEKFYIYCETIIDNQLNDKNTVTPNAIFDAILHHSKDNTPQF
jgi:hypothetical protein